MSHGDDFGPDIAPHERDELDRLAQRLVVSRPIPRPVFRGEVRRRIARPQRQSFRLRAVAHLVAGTAVLAVAALGVNDVGPLAPQPLERSALQAQAHSQ